MPTSRKSLSAAAIGLLGAALLVTAPGAANAAPGASACMLGSSNVGPRSCVMRAVNLPPVMTLGDGVCAGILSANGTAFDGPLWRYESAPGKTHSVKLRLAQGFSPLGEWAPTLLACNTTAVIDWKNFRTGKSGTVKKFVRATNNGNHPAETYVSTGSGRVRLTVHTTRPSVPVSTVVVVP